MPEVLKYKLPMTKKGVVGQRTWGRNSRGNVPDPLLQMAWHGGGTVIIITTNKKLNKLYWPSRKRSPKRLIVLSKPKSGGARQKNLFQRLSLDRCPHPLSLRSGIPLPDFNHFQIRSDATAPKGHGSRA